MMTFKILSTTDGRYVGETVEAAGIAAPGESLTHKEVSFEVVDIKTKGPYVTFYCPNYIALVKILSHGD
jgi:hypothetical protein